jgi:hypothetical protein
MLPVANVPERRFLPRMHLWKTAHNQSIDARSTATNSLLKYETYSPIKTLCAAFATTPMFDKVLFRSRAADIKNPNFWPCKFNHCIPLWNSM